MGEIVGEAGSHSWWGEWRIGTLVLEILEMSRGTFHTLIHVLQSSKFNICSTSREGKMRDWQEGR